MTTAAMNNTPTIDGQRIFDYSYLQMRLSPTQESATIAVPGVDLVYPRKAPGDPPMLTITLPGGDTTTWYSTKQNVSDSPNSVITTKHQLERLKDQSADKHLADLIDLVGEKLDGLIDLVTEGSDAGDIGLSNNSNALGTWVYYLGLDRFGNRTPQSIKNEKLIGLVLEKLLPAKDFQQGLQILEAFHLGVTYTDGGEIGELVSLLDTNTEHDLTGMGMDSYSSLTINDDGIDYDLVPITCQYRETTEELRTVETGPATKEGVRRVRDPARNRGEALVECDLFRRSLRHKNQRGKMTIPFNPAIKPLDSIKFEIKHLESKNNRVVTYQVIEVGHTVTGDTSPNTTEIAFRNIGEK